MNLKESFRYANHLDVLLDKAYGYLRNRGFVTTIKQDHLRSRANKEALDETINVAKPYDVDFTPNDVIDFVVLAITEKELLATAIASAKANIEINIDNAIALNKKRQEFIATLRNIADIKPGEKKTIATGHCFNVNGDQVKYSYDVTEITQIDFNRNDVKALIKKYTKICDDISAKLDSITINTEVVFTPTWDISDTFEDIMAAK